ncbi:MAG: exo-alpha-sialidase [Gammaproteobacteria bacterium]|nr:exo-alpha-sialidase [Gammaproteobacteria bacterium]
MRTAILALAVLGLAAGCGGNRPPDAAAAAGVDPALERVVEDWPLPATMPGSALPDLVGVQGRTLLLSWTNSQAGRRHALQFSSYDVASARWERRPTTIAVGNSMFVNWADTPHVMATRDGALWAHWLQKSGDAPYAYDIMLATSRDGGGRWSTPVSPHADGARVEHGFVSMWPRADGGLGIAWLDGRGTADGGPMALRATAVDAALRMEAETEVDASVCDCCQTSDAVTARGPLLVYRGRTPEEVRDILATRLGPEGWTTPAPVHADGWVMAACPVNGPAVAAEGEEAVVAWYTAAGGRPEVRAAYSANAGDAFAAPIVLDAGEAVQGRVAVALADGQAWLLWLREDEGGQSLWLSRRSPDLATEYQRMQVAAPAGRGRGTGFPQLAVAGGVAHVVWTDVVDGIPGLRGARVVAR